MYFTSMGLKFLVCLVYYFIVYATLQLLNSFIDLLIFFYQVAIDYILYCYMYLLSWVENNDYDYFCHSSVFTLVSGLESS